MVKVCMYFQVHQPWRLRKYSVFEIGRNPDYFDHVQNREVLERVAKKCYIPANNLLLHLIKHLDGKLKVSFSLTGSVVEQFEHYLPEVLDSFKELANTGCVEFLSETYHHSLAFIYSKEEFKAQVQLHKRMIKRLFNQTPKVFRNTELIYNNELAAYLEGMGYKGVLAEGADHILGWRSPNYLYSPRGTKSIRLMLKNFRLSDDIAFRFSNREWAEWPLTSQKFTSWISSLEGSADVVNLFMDYETLGEHQWRDTGIFTFLKKLPVDLLNAGHEFITPSEAVTGIAPKDELDIPHPTSWADMERDLSAWMGNRMQQSALKELYMLEDQIKSTGDKDLIESWRRLQCSDNFYYMCTKWFQDGDVHKYFNPFESPYEGFIAFMNAMNDLIVRSRLQEQGGQKPDEKDVAEAVAKQ